jgi:multidrug resistance efflux pump
VRCVAVSADGKVVASGAINTRVKVWDTATGRARLVLEQHRGAVLAVALTADGRTLASGGGDNAVRVCDTDGGKVWESFAGDWTRVTGLTFTPDGKGLAAACSDGWVRLWDVGTGKLRRKFRGSNKPQSVTITSDGRTLASGGLDGVVRLWDLSSGKELRLIRGGSRHMALAPDGKALATSSGKTITLWDATTGKERKTTAGHEFEVSALAFAPNSAFLASGSANGMMRLWDAVTGKQLGKLRLEFRTRVTSLAFTADSRTLVSGCRDGTIHVWQLTGPKQSSRAVPALPSRTLPVVVALSLSLNQDDPGKGERALKVPGLVRAAEEARLFPRISGYVEKWTADIGDRVKKAQVLAVLAVPEYEAELAQKKALVARAEAKVQHAQNLLKEATAALELVSSQIQEAEASFKNAQASLKYARATYERVKRLADSKSVGVAVLDEATNKLEVAKAALSAAESKLRVARASRNGTAAKQDTAESGVRVAKTLLDVARADLQRVAALLQYARIVAPFDGVITHRSVNTGDFATPSGDKSVPLYIVVRVDTVRIVVAVPDKAVPRLRVGTEATIKLDALPDRAFKGKVARLAGALDPAKRTLRAEIDLPNPDGKLLPGMSGTVTLMLGRD